MSIPRPASGFRWRLRWGRKGTHKPLGCPWAPGSTGTRQTPRFRRPAFAGRKCAGQWDGGPARSHLGSRALLGRSGRRWPPGTRWRNAFPASALGGLRSRSWRFLRSGPSRHGYSGSPGALGCARRFLRPLGLGSCAARFGLCTAGPPLKAAGCCFWPLGCRFPR